MANRLLHKLDIKLHSRIHLNDNDECFYFLEKEAEGFSKSDANNIIYNFKKPVDRKGLPEWKHKLRAIHFFTDLLCGIKYPQNTTIIPAPTSKPRNHPQWDDRIDVAVDGILKCKQNVRIEKALDTREPQIPAHIGGTRNVDSIMNNTIYTPLQSNPAMIILVDDVLTTGAHFRAWKNIIEQHNPDSQVIGFFLALHMW